MGLGGKVMAVWGIVTDKESKEDHIWFNGILNKRTGKVISPAIGRITQQQGTIMLLMLA
jgi:hypothetical protein